MKITSKDEAFKIIDNQNNGMPFEAIEYLRDYGKDDEILKKVIKSLESYDDDRIVSLYYAVVAEKHLDLALTDPVIGLFTSEIDAGDFLCEQGHYLLGKLMREIGDEAVEKCLAEIFRLHKKDTDAPYHYLFDSLRFADLDEYDAQISEMLENKDSNWAFALYGDLAHPKFERYLPKLKKLRSFYKKNKANKRYVTAIIELDEAIKNIELGDAFVEWDGRFYSEYREDWKTHYEDFAEGYEDVGISKKGKGSSETVFDKLWDSVIDFKGVEVADEVIQFFKEEISQQVTKDYDLVHFMGEFIFDLEEAKVYDKLEEFGKVVKTHQSDLYINDGEVIEEALFKYYCFKEEREKILELWSGSAQALYQEDEVLSKLVYLACNGFVNRVDQFFEKEYYSLIKDLPSGDLLIAQLGLYKLDVEFEKLYLSKDNKKDIDINDVRSEIERFNFKVESYLNYLIEVGFKDDSLEEIENLLSGIPKREKLAEIMMILRMRFLVKMLEVGCAFLVAGFIWDAIRVYIETYNLESKDWSSYFRLKKNFETYIIKIINVNNLNLEGPLLVWGVDYFLEFLLEYKIIDERQYNAQSKLFVDPKERFKDSYKFDLWKYSFICKWKAPKSIDLEDWKALEKEFHASFDLKHEENQKTDIDRIRDSLKGIGNNYLPSQPTGRVSVEKEKKIGRNEKVSVRYWDGKVVNDVKYKKVAKDVENEDCEVI